jgi:hypothetical protein
MTALLSSLQSRGSFKASISRGGVLKLTVSHKTNSARKNILYQFVFLAARWLRCCHRWKNVNARATILRHVDLDGNSCCSRMLHRIDNFEYLIMAFSCDLTGCFISFDDIRGVSSFVVHGRINLILPTEVLESFIIFFPANCNPWIPFRRYSAAGIRTLIARSVWILQVRCQIHVVVYLHLVLLIH